MEILEYTNKNRHGHLKNMKFQSDQKKTGEKERDNKKKLYKTTFLTPIRETDLRRKRIPAY